tara:strand:- start:1200 stop:1574 length:375 start_codon:yes stop_codon:yes gene_type:complete
MKQTINQTQFINAFQSWDTYKDNFSYDALELLYEYFEDYYSDTGVEMELDVVGICCDYSEMDKAELLQSYNESLIAFLTAGLVTWEEYASLPEDEQDALIDDFLCSKTSFIGYTDNHNFVFADF